MDSSFKQSAEKFMQLLEIMGRLRSPRGCPWDKEQSHRSLIPYLIEETYEVVDTLEKNDANHLKEELGDLLFQIVFHAQIASEENRFEMKEVLEGIIDKLTRRHPHVFADAKANDAQTVARHWEEIKASEKKHRDPGASLLSEVPASLPALLKAYQLGKKASKVGFDWPDLSGVFEKIREEIQELEESIQKKDLEETLKEMGDVFFSLANLSRHLKINPEEALRQTNEKFIRRFRFIEEKILAQKKSFEDFNLSELDAMWEEAKRVDNPQSSTKTV